MKKVYFEKHIQFLAKNIAGRSYEEVTRLFNSRFGMSKTVKQLGCVLKRNGLQNDGYGRGIPHPLRRKYKDRHIQFLKKNISGRSYAELVGMFNGKFGFSINVKALMSLCKKHKLSNGRACRFLPGSIPLNKGIKKWWKGGEETQFKPGNIPGNTLPIGSERITRDGYIEIKYANKPGTAKNRWKSKHAMIWEKANGPIPKGHVVIFADGNNRNFKLGNLLLVSRKELAVLNHARLLTDNGEMSKVAAEIAKVKVLLSGRKRDTLKPESKTLIVIDNTGKKIRVFRDRNSGYYFAARETRHGPKKILSKELKERATLADAQEDLRKYAIENGWRKE